MKKLIWGSILAAIVAFFIWAQVSGDQWLAEFNAERTAAATAFYDKGVAQGKVQNQQACMDDAVKQIAQDLEATTAIDAGHYLRGCWSAESASEGFCADVPAYNEEATNDEKEWARFACYDLNARSDGCRLLMRQKQLFCKH